MYISVVSVLVNDVNRAIDFYCNKLGWEKTADVAMDEQSRWVTVAPPNEKAAFTLTKGGPTWSADRVGGFSGVIVEVDDVFAAHDQLKQRGVEFAEPPRNEPWGGWAMFVDSEGNTHGMHSAPRGAAN
jgi:predicted enzyme related to lactoylglutathione lyase